MFYGNPRNPGGRVLFSTTLFPDQLAFRHLSITLNSNGPGPDVNSGPTEMNALRYYPIAATGVALIALGVGYMLRRRRKTPEQLERERRDRLSKFGRITDGTVIDAQETEVDGHGTVQWLIYRYDISGVQYEASQDVTHLQDYVDIHKCRVGVPSSVRYNPQNPGDSIVVSETWNGLRFDPIRRSGIVRARLETEGKR